MSEPIEDLQLGEAFRQSVKPKADRWDGPAPMWYGWVVMDAFLAGLKEGRKQAIDAAVKEEREACAKIAADIVEADCNCLECSGASWIRDLIRKRGQA